MGEFIFVLFVCPFLIFVTSIIGTRLTKTYYVMPLVTFAVFLIVAVFFFSPSFFLWVGMYSIFSFIVSRLTFLFVKGDRKIERKY